MDDPERIARDAAACARANNATAPPPEPYCEGTFDSWLCWPPTRANSTAFVPCPDFVPGFSAELSAHKECSANGSWFRHPDTGRPWSNYTTCVKPEDVSAGAPAPGPASPAAPAGRERHHRGVRGRLQRVAGGAPAVAGHPAVLPQPALRAHHRAHEPVRVVRAQQRAVAAVVRRRGARAGHHAGLARLVPRAQRRAAVRHADHVHVDAVRGAVPAHGAGVRVRVGAAAAARAAGARLGAAAGAGGGQRGAARRRRRAAVLDGRGRAAHGAGRAGRGRRAAQPGLPVQHRARAVHQAARGRRGRHGGRGAAVGHGAARAARHVPAGAAAGPAVPAHAVPAAARRLLVAGVRVRGRAHHLAAGAVRGRALLLLQRRGAGAAAAALARADVPAARQLHHGHDGLVRALGGRGRRRGQGVTGGGRGAGGRGGPGGARAPLRAPHPLRARRQRRGGAARRAPAVSALRVCLCCASTRIVTCD